MKRKQQTGQLFGSISGEEVAGLPAGAGDTGSISPGRISSLGKTTGDVMTASTIFGVDIWRWHRCTGGGGGRQTVDSLSSVHSVMFLYFVSFHVIFSLIPQTEEVCFNRSTLNSCFFCFFVFFNKSTSVFLPLTYCPPPKSSMVLATIYDMIIGSFKVKVCWIQRAAIFVKMHLSSSSWFDPACHFKSVSVSCSLLNVLLILSQQMPSILFCCCINVLFFLSPDFKYVQVCVKVCVRGWISIFSFFVFLPVGDMLGCVFFMFSDNHVRGTPTFLPRGCDDTGSCLLLTVLFWCVDLSQRQIIYGFRVQRSHNSPPNQHPPPPHTLSLCLGVATVDCFSLTARIDELLLTGIRVKYWCVDKTLQITEKKPYHTVTPHVLWQCIVYPNLKPDRNVNP